MPKRQFDFSPSVQLILGNLPTIRKVQELLIEGTVAAEVKRCLKYLEVTLQQACPELKTWKSEINDSELYFYPENAWRVVTDDHIAFCFSMYQCIEPSFYSDEDDPIVGLYVPEWKHRQNFANHLKRFHIAGFQHTSDDDCFPLWSTVHLGPLVKQSKLSLDLLERAIVQRFRRLVGAEAKISKLISVVRQKPA